MQLSAYFVRAGVSGDANVDGAHLTNDANDDELRLTTTDDGRILRQPFAVTIKRLGTGRPADDFDTPRLVDCSLLGREPSSIENLSAQVAREVLRRRRIQSDVSSARPSFNRATCHQTHVSLCFTTKYTVGREPVTNSARPGVVGSCSKTEVAKLPVQLTQQLGRFDNRMVRIERIFEAAQSRRLRHELGNPLRPGAAAGKSFAAPRQCLAKVCRCQGRSLRLRLTNFRVLFWRCIFIGGGHARRRLREDDCAGQGEQQIEIDISVHLSAQFGDPRRLCNMINWRSPISKQPHRWRTHGHAATDRPTDCRTPDRAA